MSSPSQSDDTPACHIARAEPGDLDAIGDVFLAARRFLLPGVPMVHSDADTRGWIKTHLFAETDLWAAWAGERLAAMMALTPGWIEHLYVDPACHDRGIGTALLRHAKASPLGQRRLELWTFQVNAKGRRFYERNGFRPAEFTDGAGNEERTPDVRYAWSPSI